MREGQGDRILLGVVLLATLWNSSLLLNTRREIATATVQAQASASSTKVLEQMSSQLGLELTEELVKHEKALSRDGQVCSSSQAHIDTSKKLEEQGRHKQTIIHGVDAHDCSHKIMLIDAVTQFHNLWSMQAEAADIHAHLS